MPRNRITRSQTVDEREPAVEAVPDTKDTPIDPPRRRLPPRKLAKSSQNPKKLKLDAIKLELADLHQRFGPDRIHVVTNPPRGVQRISVLLPDPLGVEKLVKILRGPTVATKHEVMVFLQSGGVIPQLSIWSKQYDRNAETSLQKRLEHPLPSTPWSNTAEQDLAKRIAYLAGLPTSRMQAEEPSALLLCCVEYTKTLRIKNRQTFFDGYSISSQQTLLFCSTLLLIAYRDYTANPKDGFFAVLLRSMLVHPMFQELRDRWEEFYKLPAATEKEVGVSFERKYKLWAEEKSKLNAEKEEQDHRPIDPRAALEVLNFVPSVDGNRFTDVEQLLYLEAFLEYKQDKETGKKRVNIGYISVIMAFRSSAECVQHHYARKSRATQSDPLTGTKRPASAALENEAPPQKSRKFGMDQRQGKESSPTDSVIGDTESGLKTDVVSSSALVEMKKRCEDLLADQDNALRREEQLRKGLNAKLIEKEDELSVLRAAQLSEKAATLAEVQATQDEMEQRHRKKLDGKDISVKSKQNVCIRLAEQIVKKDAEIRKLQATQDGLAREKDRAEAESSRTYSNHTLLMGKKNAEMNQLHSAKAALENDLSAARKRADDAEEDASNANIQAEHSRQEAKGKDEADEVLASVQRSHKVELDQQKSNYSRRLKKRDDRCEQLAEELRRNGLQIPDPPAPIGPPK